jgi:tetratricopeptide (TPR) repeat protein
VRQFGPKHPHVAQTLNNLAVLYATQGRYDEAERLYQQALALRIAADRDDHLTAAETRNNLATLYYAQALYEEARQLYERALEV